MVQDNQQMSYIIIDKPKANNKVFSMSITNGIIKYAIVNNIRTKPKKLQVQVDKGHIYVIALNVRNAKRKFENNVTKLLQQIKDGTQSTIQ